MALPGNASRQRQLLKTLFPELEEDQDNPETLFLLARAYKETGAIDKKPCDRRSPANHEICRAWTGIGG